MISGDPTERRVRRDTSEIDELDAKPAQRPPTINRCAEAGWAVTT
jgi:hypothetical protein